VKISFTLVLSFLSVLTLGQPTMASGTNNATAFGSNNEVGTDNSCTYYVAFDNTYLYVGWSGGRTNYSSDTYFIGIDTDPSGTNGNTAAIQGATFNSSNSRKLDYYVVYENSSSLYGAPVTNGNAFELYENNSGSTGWDFVSRSGGNNNTSSRVDFQNSPGGEVRLRISWSDLGNFSNGSSNSIGILLWTNNSTGNFIWSSLPSSNPTGSTNQQLTDYVVFSNTSSGAATNSGTNTALPVSLLDFSAQLNPNNQTLLSWSTASELNASHFSIHRSFDGVDKVKIGEVNAQGNSNEVVEYSFLDVEPISQRTLYFLEQKDFDGATEWFGPVAVHLNQQEGIAANFNKGAGQLELEFAQLPEAEKARVTILNAVGQQVLNTEINLGVNQKQLDVTLPTMATGVYIVTTQVGDKLYSNKLYY
jgi:hypothetical protein